MTRSRSSRLREVEIRLCFLEERLEALAREQLALLRECEALRIRILRLERAARPEDRADPPEGDAPSGLDGS